MIWKADSGEIDSRLQGLFLFKVDLFFNPVNVFFACFCLIDVYSCFTSSYQIGLPDQVLFGFVLNKKQIKKQQSFHRDISNCTSIVAASSQRACSFAFRTDSLQLTLPLF